MAAAALGPEIFRFGFRMNPTPQEAATYYLPRLIAGAPLHDAVRAVIHDADVYACEPGALARRFPPLPRTGDRFFFTARRLQTAGKSGSRAVRAAGDDGSWQAQGGKDIRDSGGGGAKVGEVKKLRYKKGGVFTDWLMDEFSCCLDEALVGGGRQLVLCKIYVSPKADPNSVARQESAAFFSVPPAPAAPAVATAAPKRPAPPQVAEPPCPKRARAAGLPTPTVVQPAGCTASLSPPAPCVATHRGVAPSWNPRSATRPYAPAQPAACPRLQQGRLPAPPRPRAPPQQNPLLPTTPALHGRHTPQQAPACHCRPQPSAQFGPPVVPLACPPAIHHDPFEAAMPESEAPVEARVEAADPPPPPASEEGLNDEDFADFVKDIEEVVSTVEAEEEATAENGAREVESVAAADVSSSPASASVGGLNNDDDFLPWLVKEMETVPTMETEMEAGGSMMAGDDPFSRFEGMSFDGMLQYGSSLETTDLLNWGDFIPA